MEFHDTFTVTSSTQRPPQGGVPPEIIAAAWGASNAKPKTDSFQDKVKDLVQDEARDRFLGKILGGTIGGLITVAGAVYLCLRKKVCGQTDENEQPNATAEAPIEASTCPNLNPLQATVGYSTTNDEEELDSQRER
jgi:hypothetical protein